MTTPTIRELEHCLQASGVTRTQARRAIHFMRAEGFLEVLMPAQEQPPKRGILSKLKTALSGK